SLLPVKTSIVAEVCEFIPSDLKTLRTVIHKIRKSKTKLMLSTYHTSYSNFCFQDIAFLPFTCAQPVIPGHTSCLRRCVSLYKGRYCTNKGLGPTRLISPFNTLINCGISSNEVLRII